MSEWKEEYREVGQNFRDGFKLMFEISKSCITINSFLFAAFAVLDNFRKSSADFSLSLFLICVIGVLSSLGFGVAHWRISRYLRGFVLRAKEIEDKQSFLLYNRVYDYEMAGRSKKLNNVKIPLVAFSVLGVVWVALIFRSFGILNISINL